MPTTIPDAEQALALQTFLKSGPPELVSPEGARMILPEPYYTLLKHLARNARENRAATVTLNEEAITTQQAANILGVSRPYLVQLLEAGELPFYRIGKHRRLRLKDVLEYEAKRDAERHTILNQMTEDAVRDGLYDPENIFIPEGGRDR